MPLDEVQLDDLNWSQLTTVTRDRIAGVSSNEWTLHAPVDPGVTVLELLAAQFEQRVYWMDQPSDVRTRALLALLGVQPRPVRAARTVLQCSPHQFGNHATSWIVPQGAMFEERLLSPSDDVRRFSTLHAGRMLPIRAERPQRSRRSRTYQPATEVRLIVGGEDRTVDLNSGRAPCLLPLAAGETRIDIPVNGASMQMGSEDAPICILFEIDSPDAVKPEWLQFGGDSQGLGDPRCDDASVPAMFSVTWHYITSKRGQANQRREHRFKMVDDGTGGFRRSGVVRLAASGNAVQEADLLTIILRSHEAPIVPLPRVIRIAPNAMIAEHRVRREFTSALGQANGPEASIMDQILVWRKRRLPGNKLDLRPLEAKELPIPSSVNFAFMGRQFKENGKDVPVSFRWTPVSDFSRLGPEDRRFTVDRPGRQLDFGDGINGRLPVPSAAVQRLCFAAPVPTQGSFRLHYGGQTTADIRFDAPADVVQAALRALPNTDANSAVCSGGPLPGRPVTIHFAAGQHVLEALTPDLDTSAPRVVVDFHLSLDVGGGPAGNLTMSNVWRSTRLQFISFPSRPTSDFTLSLSGQTTGSIPKNADASAVEKALRELSNLPSGGVKCSGGPLPQQTISVEFVDNFLDQRPVPMLVADGSSPPSVAVQEAINVVSAQGGSEGETVAEAAARTRTELRKPSRAVTVDDIEAIAETTSGVSVRRARAAVGYHPDYPCIPVPGAVTVYIVPGLPKALRRFWESSCGDDLVALRPDSGALEAVARRLGKARLLTQEIFVRPPIYEEIELEVEISGAVVSPDSLRNDVIRALGEFTHPLFGGPDQTGWPFGYPVRPSELVRVVQDVIVEELHVKRVGIRKFSKGVEATSTLSTWCSHDYTIANDQGERNFESCEDTEIADHALVAVRGIRVALTAQTAVSGGLL